MSYKLFWTEPFLPSILTVVTSVAASIVSSMVYYPFLISISSMQSLLYSISSWEVLRLNSFLLSISSSRKSCNCSASFTLQLSLIWSKLAVLPASRYVLLSWFSWAGFLNSPGLQWSPVSRPPAKLLCLEAAYLGLPKSFILLINFYL